MNRSKYLIIVFFLWTGCSFETEDDWFAKTRERTFEQIDRIGRPHLELLIINPERLKIYREDTDPTTDEEKLTQIIKDEISDFRAILSEVDSLPGQNSGLSIEQATELLVPDVLTLDFGQQITFIDRQNGRKLDEDSFDEMLKIFAGRDDIDTISLKQEFGDGIEKKLGATPEEEDSGIKQAGAISNDFPFFKAPVN